jgi:CMP-N-acetylneuraminate monooxygenase
MNSDKGYRFGNQLSNQKIEWIQKIAMPKSEQFSIVGDLILGKKNGAWLAYDRVCDHNGGTLSLDPGNQTATCPIHKWTLNLNHGKYENNCEKAALKIQEYKSHLEIQRYRHEFEAILASELIDEKIELYFNAHASITTMIDGITLSSDPWLIGSCFATGWWHSNPPSEEALQRIKESHYIYISHNHPDHLHIPTLEKYVSKKTSIIIPNFASKSVESTLLNLGYKNLIVTDFLKELNIKTDHGEFRVIIVKSGDDRDDSSLLIKTKNNGVFLGVDTNMPNKWILPNVDVLFTPFASGASGFPSRIENFSLKQKKEIIQNNKLSILNNHVKKLVSATNAKYVIPYAGYFTESPRDADIKHINIKNSATDLIQFIADEFPQSIGIDPILHPHITLYKSECKLDEKIELPSYFVDDEYINDEISYFTGPCNNLTDDLLELLGNRYIQSSFYDNLIIVFLPSNADFSKVISKGLVINFSKENRSFELINTGEISDQEIAMSLKNQNSDSNIEILRVRSDSLIGAITKGLPIEDLSIGFQIKMYRDPNVYNFKFWDHFTNLEFVKIEVLKQSEQKI